MKTFLLGATSLVLIAAGSALAQPVPVTSSTPQVQRSVRIHTNMKTRDQVAAHVRRMFARFDSNRDGFITQDEVASAGKRVRVDMRRNMDRRLGGPDARHLPNLADRGSAFDRLDANHDGVITRNEFVNAQPQMLKREIRIVRNGRGPGEMGGMGHMERGGMMKHMFAMADANRDGRLSLDEATNAALRHFDMADVNHNGRLDPGEHMHIRRMMDGNAPR